MSLADQALSYVRAISPYQPGKPITELARLKKVYAAYEAKPGPQLVEAQRNRRISLYVIKP